MTPMDDHNDIPLTEADPLTGAGAPRLHKGAGYSQSPPEAPEPAPMPAPIKSPGYSFEQDEAADALDAADQLDASGGPDGSLVPPAGAVVSVSDDIPLGPAGMDNDVTTTGNYLAQPRQTQEIPPAPQLVGATNPAVAAPGMSAAGGEPTTLTDDELDRLTAPAGVVKVD